VLERLFRLRDAGTTVRAELVGGATTFVTLSYIIFVQPAVLGVAGMDFGAVLVATCVASALATLVMGLYANYPIAVAPAMGHNWGCPGRWRWAPTSWLARCSWRWPRFTSARR